jgi:hypothetical protein
MRQIEKERQIFVVVDKGDTTLGVSPGELGLVDRSDVGVDHLVAFNERRRMSNLHGRGSRLIRLQRFGGHRVPAIVPITPPSCDKHPMGKDLRRKANLLCFMPVSPPSWRNTLLFKDM